MDTAAQQPRVALALHADVKKHPSLIDLAPQLVRRTGDRQQNLVRYQLSHAADSLRQTCLANAWPNFNAYWRPLIRLATQSLLTVMPRAASSLSNMHIFRGTRR